MKRLSFLSLVFVLMLCLSSCSIFKGKKCDCPKFSEQPTAPPQTEAITACN